MREYLEAVKEFQAMLASTAKPSIEFRDRLFNEELQELKDATTLEDKIDALIDIAYVVLGTHIYYPFHPYDTVIEVQRCMEFLEVDFQAHFLEVHKCNMAKIPSSPENPSSRGDTTGIDFVKPKGWVGPDHMGVIRDSKN